MSRNDIANLAFKITGLYCLIQFLSQIHVAIGLITYVLSLTSMAGMPGIPALSGAASWFPIIGGGIPVLGLGFFGWLLIARSREWASRVFPDQAPESPSTPVLAMHALAFSVVGLFAIVDALPETARNLAMTGLYFAGLGKGMVVATSEGWIRMIAPAIKLGLGLLLVFRAHYLVRWWSRLRYAGLSRKLGLCRYCGYNLVANTSGVCPECGTPTQSGNETGES